MKDNRSRSAYQMDQKKKFKVQFKNSYHQKQQLSAIQNFNDKEKQTLSVIKKFSDDEKERQLESIYLQQKQQCFQKTQSLKVFKIENMKKTIMKSTLLQNHDLPYNIHNNVYSQKTLLKQINQLKNQNKQQQLQIIQLNKNTKLTKIVELQNYITTIKEQLKKTNEKIKIYDKIQKDINNPVDKQIFDENVELSLQLKVTRHQLLEFKVFIIIQFLILQSSNIPMVSYLNILHRHCYPTLYKRLQFQIFEEGFISTTVALIFQFIYNNLKNSERQQNFSNLKLKEEQYLKDYQKLKDELKEKQFQNDFLSEQNIQLLKTIQTQKEQNLLNEIQIQDIKMNKKQLVQICKKQEGQIEELNFIQKLLEKQKDQSNKDNKFLADMLINQKKNPQLGRWIEENNNNESQLQNQFKRKKLVIKEDVKGLFQEIKLNLRAAGKDIQKVYKAYFQYEKKLSVQQLIELLQEYIIYQINNFKIQTFKVQNYSDAFKLARYLVEVDRPIQNLNHLFETDVIFSIFKTNIGVIQLDDKEKQDELEKEIKIKIQPKKQFIENWIVDIYQKRECQKESVVSWKQFDYVLESMGIIFEKEEYSHIELLNYQINNMIDQINMRNFLDYIFKEQSCKKCLIGVKKHNCKDCKEVVPFETNKKKAVHFQQSVNKIIHINQMLSIKKTKSKEI